MNIAKALQSLRPNKEFVFNDNDLSTVRWSEAGVITPTLEEIEAELARLAQEEADKKAAAEAKLAALGLTPEDFKALLS